MPVTPGWADALMGNMVYSLPIGGIVHERGSFGFGMCMWICVCVCVRVP